MKRPTRASQLFYVITVAVGIIAAVGGAVCFFSTPRGSVAHGAGLLAVILGAGIILACQ